MNLPAFCIKRPAFTIVISLILVIIGLISFLSLPIRWIPNVTPPEAVIITTYPGANASLVEHDVTKVIEDSLSGIGGVEMISSHSRQGSSQISITFKLGQNMDRALEELRSALERVRGALPRGIENPLVMKADPNNMPILFITFHHPNYHARELTDYIDKFIRPAIESVDGVGNVQVYGKRLTAMHIWLHPSKLAAARVTVDEVTRLLQTQNASIPSGQIQSTDRNYSVITDTTLKTAKEFNNLIVHNQNKQIVRIRDIGEAKFDAENEESAFRINGKSAIGLGIIPQATANPLAVEVGIQKTLKDIQRSLPLGMKMEIEYNQADHIRASINSVYESFIESVVFVWLVILAFLCSFRATLIPIVTIPVCVIGSFALLYFLDFSINIITLMALVLAIGLVVDDAIVMLENINRYIEKGMSSVNAALKGSKEIVFPIIAMTLTLTAVYAPIAFTSGLIGVLFKEFTFTLAGTVLISGMVALTLSPMMCAKLLKNENPNRYHTWLTTKLLILQKKYQRLLTVILKRKVTILIILGAVAGAGGLTYKYLPSEFAPAEDMNELNAFIVAPRSASFQYTDHYVQQVEAILEKTPDVVSSLTQVGSFSANHAWQFIRIKPKNERTASLPQLVNQLSLQLNTIPGVRANIFPPSPELAQFVGSDQGDKIGLVLMTSNDYLKLQQSSSQLVEAIKAIPGFSHVDNKLKWDSEQFRIDIDRERAADLNVSIADITETISTFLAGKIVGKTGENNIIVKMQKSANPNVLNNLYVRNDNGIMLPLSQFLHIYESSAPEIVSHFNRLRSDTIYMTLTPDFKIADAINTVEQLAKEILPDDIRYSFTGEAKSFLDSYGKTFITFGLALVFIYLVLVAQFESFIDPLIILLTVPFAIVGALFTLKIFGGSMNIYSNIGLITLIGLIAKHGILITEFANRLRENGKSIEEAVIEASMLRLRPILMTTAAMVLGALPLALAFGPGAESRQQIGLVITGGMLFGTFFSLIVVPVFYTFLSPLRSIQHNDLENQEKLSFTKGNN